MGSGTGPAYCFDSVESVVNASALLDRRSLRTRSGSTGGSLHTWWAPKPPVSRRPTVGCTGEANGAPIYWWDIPRLVSASAFSIASPDRS